MKKIILSIVVVAVCVSLSFGFYWANNACPEDPKGSDCDPAGRKSAFARVSHEHLVQQAASNYFKARAKINEAYAAMEMEQDATIELQEAYIYLIDAAELFNSVSNIVNLSPENKKKYVNFGRYPEFINNPKYKSKTMQEVVNFFSKGDMPGFYIECSKIMERIAGGVKTMTINPSVETGLGLYELVNNDFGFYGTILARAIMQ